MINLARALANNRILIQEMTVRDIRDRYVGQVLGLLWFLVHSIFTILIYIFLFSFVYKSSGNHTPDFSLYLIAGLVPWMFLTECMVRGVMVIRSNSSLVKQVVFPVEVLPIKIVLSTMISLGLNLLIIFSLVLFKTGFSLIMLTLPLLVFSLLVLSLGLVFILSAVGAYLKDLKDLVQMFTSLGVYLLPIVYFEAWVPNIVRPLIQLNPLTYVIYCFHDVFYYQYFKHPEAWFIFPIFSFVICFMGFKLFTKFKLSFGNFL